MGYVANQRDLLITSTVLTAATMLAVGARFWARHRLRAKNGPDDWCALAAGLIFFANNITLWWGTFVNDTLLSGIPHPNRFIGIVNNYQGIDPLIMSQRQLTISLKAG